MAFSIDTGEYPHKRTDHGWLADPRGLVIDWKKNLSRGGVRPPVDADLVTLAKSMLPKDKGGRGQLQPVDCRPLPDRRVEVFLGFRRMAAALWLIDQGHDFQIGFVIRKVNDAEAALDNMVENLERLAPKPIEMAHAIRSLRESYGLTHAEIAARFHRSQKWVRTTEDLVMLPAPIQAAVADGTADVTAAQTLATLPDPIATFDAVKAATGGKVTATAVKQHKQKQHDAALDAGVARPVALKPTSRNFAKELRPLLADLSIEGEHPAGVALAKAITAFMAGEATEKKFLAAWSAAFPVPKS